MALAGEEKNSLLYESMENLGPENHHLIRPSSGGGGAAATPPGFGGGSKAVANYGRNNLAGIRYRECLKNHAAAIGGNVTDGCGEFMPSGEDGSLEAFKCAACSCHRNFHRKEGAGGGDMVVHPLQLTPAPPLHGSGAGWSSAVKMAFGGGGGSGGSAATDSSSGEELNFNAYQSGGGTAAVPPQFVLAKKRHRTKFSVDQKEKMLAFAEKLGWRIPREDDTEVQRFCSEVGVKRQVFKVWMHNNKNSSSAKKTTTPTHPHPQDHHHHHHLQPPQQQQQIHQDNSRINNHE